MHLKGGPCRDFSDGLLISFNARIKGNRRVRSTVKLLDRYLIYTLAASSARRVRRGGQIFVARRRAENREAFEEMRVVYKFVFY